MAGSIILVAVVVRMAAVVTTIEAVTTTKVAEAVAAGDRFRLRLLYNYVFAHDVDERYGS